MWRRSRRDAGAWAPCEQVYPGNAGDGETAAVGPSRRRHLVFFGTDDGDELREFRTPDPHCAVMVGAGKPGAIRGGRHRGHQASVPGEGGGDLAGGSVRDLALRLPEWWR
jgi:hypothetical protein